MAPIQHEEACGSGCFNRQSQRFGYFSLFLKFAMSFVFRIRKDMQNISSLAKKKKKILNGQTLSGMLNSSSKIRVSSTRTQENQCVPMPISSICWRQKNHTFVIRTIKYKYYVMLKDEFMS